MTDKAQAQSPASIELSAAIASKIGQALARLMDGTMSTKQATAIYKALCLPAAPAKKRGRPVGARTKANTEAVKRAREVVRLVTEEAMELNQAVKRVADKEGKTVSSVYQELWRHDDRLAEEAIQEGRAIEHAAGLHFVEKYPSLAEKVRLIVAECFGNIALACEALGNADSAAQVRALAPELGEELTTRFAGLLLTSLPLAPK